MRYVVVYELPNDPKLTEMLMKLLAQDERLNKISWKKLLIQKMLGHRLQVVICRRMLLFQGSLPGNMLLRLPGTT